MAKSPEEMAAAMIANMKEKTGKTMPQWLKIAKASKLHKHGELVKHLKSEHGMTHGFANMVAHETLQSSAASSNAGDLGINLKGVKPQGKLEASGSFNSMVSHRVRLERVQDVDSKVKAWLKQAYASA